MNKSALTSQSRLARDLAIAGLLLLATATLAFLTPDVISREVSYRAYGVLMGLVVLFYANEAPKTLPPLERVRNPVAEQAKRRFTGWAITFGGVAYLLTWLIAPVTYAPPIAMTLMALSVAAPIGRCVLGRRRASSDSSIPVTD